MQNKNYIKKECIHCHLCQNNCSFLKKYNIDIGNVEEIEKLAYHCFLCSKCTSVCPKGIDGRNFILKLREEKVKSDKSVLKNKSYKLILSEKKDYIFKNYRHINNCESVLFTGCNFVSFYPKTTKKIIDLFKNYNIGVIYDCCRKPVEELGLGDIATSEVFKINEKLIENNIKEVIMLCPNCYFYLKEKLKDIKVTSIYDKLNEINIGNKNIKDGLVFIPCPDRESRELLNKIEKFVNKKFNIISEINCCGLGGCALVKEPELAKQMSLALNDKNEKIYTYCATCAGNFIRSKNNNVTHILTEIMETYEKASVKMSFINRVKTKFI